jgi:hypothetical protein
LGEWGGDAGFFPRFLDHGGRYRDARGDAAAHQIVE